MSLCSQAGSQTVVSNIVHGEYLKQAFIVYKVQRAEEAFNWFKFHSNRAEYIGGEVHQICILNRTILEQLYPNSK